MSRRPLDGSGSCEVGGTPDELWQALLDPQTLHGLIPGMERLEQVDDRYDAWLSYGAGRIRARYHVQLVVSDLQPPNSLALSGQSEGGVGWGSADAVVTLREVAPGRTRIAWRYQGVIGGPVALLGGLVLRSAARIFVGRFFATLAGRGPPPP